VGDQLSSARVHDTVLVHSACQSAAASAARRRFWKSKPMTMEMR
jgi:hypothetical protein